MNIEIRKTEDVKEWAKEQLKNAYDYDVYFYEELLKIKEKEFNCITKNSKIIDIFYIDNYHELTVIIPTWSSHRDTKEELKLLKDTYPDAIFDLGEYPNFNLESFGMTLVNVKDSEYNSEYCIGSRHLACVVCNKDSLMNTFKKNFFNNVSDLNEIEIKCLTQKEVKFFLKKEADEIFYIPHWENDCNSLAFCGFHYLSQRNISEAKYLTAIYKNNIVVIIKVGEYGSGKDERQSINFIDIRVDWKNKGLATLLINSLDPYLNSSKPLLVTEESNEGKKCGMLKKFKEYVKIVKVYSFKEFYSISR